MANTLLITKETGGYFSFVLNGNTAKKIQSIGNDLLIDSMQCHFKTRNGANIIKEQSIYPTDVTLVAGGTFTFTTTAQLWTKLIEVGYFSSFEGLGKLDSGGYIGNAQILSDTIDTKLNSADYNEHFKGVYLTLSDLNTAHPTASVGDYAQVNELGATDVVNYNWDAEENIWIKNSIAGSGATNTDELPEGTSNLYFTVTRFLANLTFANIISALGFTPENSANKQNSLVTDGTGVKYATVDAVNSGLAIKAIDEGNGIGYVISSRNPLNYGPVGLGAVDLSTSNEASNVNGATGNFSFTTGTQTIASGLRSTAGGVFSTASGDNSNANGLVLTAKSFGEYVVGTRNTIYTPNSATTFHPLDRIFGVGNGASVGNESDALIILKNGLTTLPSVTNALITAEPTGKAVVTKEYLINAPISTATQIALNLKADLASPTFTGVPLAPTATPGTNTTQIATTAFVTGADAGNVKLTGNQSILGTKTFNSSAGSLALGVSIVGSGTGVSINNQNSGIGLFLSNASSGFGLVLNGLTGSNGNLISGQNNSSTTFIVTKEGATTATSFINSTAPATNALLANGTTLANPISGTGTTGYLSKFTSAGVLGNSLVQDDGTDVMISKIGSTSLNIQTNINGSPSLFLTAGGSDGMSMVYDRATSEIRFSNSGASNAFKISNAGASTFSSSVTATAFNKPDGTPYVGILPVTETGTSFSLTDAYNGKVVILTASCTVTIPDGLVAGFEVSIVTLAGVTLTIAQGASVVLFNNAGTTMAEKLSMTLKNRTATNQYITTGNI